MKALRKCFDVLVIFRFAGMGLLFLSVIPSHAAVIIEQKNPTMHMRNIQTYQGVRMRVESDGPGGHSVSLTMPDENRVLELMPAQKKYVEKPLGAELAQMQSLQQTMARDAKLISEEVSLKKLGTERIAGMDCQNHLIKWTAEVQTAQGRKKYSLLDELCMATSAVASAAREAAIKHMQAVAGRFGEAVEFEKGELSIFDMGRMYFGVPAKKFNTTRGGLAGFPLRERFEIDFGGVLMEPMVRGMVKEDGGSDAEADEMTGDMQEAMKMMQDPKYKAQMSAMMKQMQDPKIQEQMRQFMSPEQQQQMNQSMEHMKQGNMGLPTNSSGSALVVSYEVVSIAVTPDMPERTEVPKGYAFSVKPMLTSPSKKQDQNDGDGALSREEVKRLAESVRAGQKAPKLETGPRGAYQNASPWMEVYQEWEGVPYLWGGTTKRGVDCSGLSKNAYASVVQLTLPRTAAEQKETGPHLSLDQARVGDLIFFDTGFRHVGIYLAQNKFFHASSSKGVTISSLSNAYWNNAYRFIVRPDSR